ncbi:MAG: acetylglutamate kinase [Planctomycetes bacterium]|nr:acetylglutamate kinase [Planctomycetota bacterium]
MQEAIAKAAVLIEAIPYIRRFRGKTVVVKLGGSFMDVPEDLEAVCTDIAFMRAVDIDPVVVHGGGKAITRAMQEAGLAPRFVGGLRYTGPEELRIVEDVLASVVNPQIVRLLEQAGAKAEGLTSKTRCPLRAERLAGPGGADLGLVGRATGVDDLLLRGLCDLGTIPVIAPIAVASDRPPPGVAGAAAPPKYNCNADEAASAVARALGAEKLVNVSDTHGIRERPDDAASLLSHISESDAERLLESGVISGGMIPKVQTCLEALKGGVRKCHIISGRVPHSLLLEIYTDRGVGTEIVP